MDCGPLPVGVNTEGISDEYNTKYLDYYRYRCLTGYTTNDTTVVQCLASKSWSHPPPTCHGNYTNYMITAPNWHSSYTPGIIFNMFCTPSPSTCIRVTIYAPLPSSVY